MVRCGILYANIFQAIEGIITVALALISFGNLYQKHHSSHEADTTLSYAY